MSDTPATKVARHLREIEDLALRLPTTAYNRARDREIPGGNAMVMMGPGADLAAYRYRQMSALLGRVDVPTDITDGDPDVVLQVLAFWANELRAERGEMTDLPATLGRCGDYIRHTLDWAFSEESGDFPADEMQRELSKLRHQIENVLREGKRPELGVPCMYDECGGTRIRRHIEPVTRADGTPGGEWSDWFCDSCGREWDDDTYRLNVKAAAQAAQTEVVDGQVWSTVGYAAAVTGRAAGTIRMWATLGFVRRACLILGRRTGYVSLDDARTKAAEAKRRKRVES